MFNKVVSCLDIGVTVEVQIRKTAFIKTAVKSFQQVEKRVTAFISKRNSYLGTPLVPSPPPPTPFPFPFLFSFSFFSFSLFLTLLLLLVCVALNSEAPESSHKEEIHADEVILFHRFGNGYNRQTFYKQNTDIKHSGCSRWNLSQKSHHLSYVSEIFPIASYPLPDQTGQAWGTTPHHHLQLLITTHVLDVAHIVGKIICANIATYVYSKTSPVKSDYLLEL